MSALGGKLDRLEAERLARKAGLPDAVAGRIADVVTAADLPEDRRREVFRELVSHFEDGLGSGKSVDELLRSFGDGRRTGALIGAAKRVVTREDAGGAGPRDGWLGRLVRDARYAIRRLAARPSFTATAILSLALGIGANSAMFTLVNEVILRKPALVDPERLVDLYRSAPDAPFSLISEPDIADIRANTTVFAGLATSKLSLAPYQVGDRLQRLTAELISPDYFTVLGIRPQLGRLIVAEDAPAPGQGAVAVLSDHTWRLLFGADRGIVGKAIQLNGSSYQVLGVAPPDYPGRLRGVATDVWVPVMMIDQFERSVDGLRNRGNNSTFVSARLAPGATVEQARVELGRLGGENVARKVGDWVEGSVYTVLPRADVIFFPPVDKYLRPVATVLMLVVGLVLAIACANLAGFLLARAVDRKKEIAVRLALGATRAQLIGQLLVETVLLALAGGAVGVLVGRAGLAALLRSDFPLPVTFTLDLRFDWRVLAFSMTVSIVAGVLFGLMPALKATRLEIATVIRDEHTGGGRSKWALRHLLVGGQVAISMVLLVVAGLFVRSLDAARRVQPGFGRDPAAALWVGIAGNVAPGAGKASLDRLVREVAALPGVTAVGLTRNIHLNGLGTSSGAITVDGVAPPPGRDSHEVDHAPADTGYLAAVGLRLVAGRNFTQAEQDEARPVAIVNEAFAAKFFPGREPVGQRYRSGSRDIEVIGVVNTAKVRNLGESPRPFIYYPFSGDGPTWMVARTRGDADALVPQILQTMQRVDPSLYPMWATTLARHIAVMSYPLKMGATALTGFAILALVMACIGLYGAVSYAVSQRSREVGIRLSLGAGRTAVVRLLLLGGVRLVIGGAVVGFALSLLISRLVEGLLFGVGGLDPLTLVVVPSALIGVAVLAAYVPARRAGRIDPLRALKAE